MTDLVLLSALLPGPQHGYALKKHAALFSGKREVHNNLVYPLLHRFVENGWVSKRRAPGQRGQTRELYALTAKGKDELLRRIAHFTEKEAASENEFHLRVGLFVVLDPPVRLQILSTRDRWLAGREQRLAHIASSMDTGRWGGEVIRHLRERTHCERLWIAALKRKSRRERPEKTSSMSANKEAKHVRA
jgi:DNA-binding PadR family transcriptional regulator